MNPDSTWPSGHELTLAIIGAVAMLLVLPPIGLAGSLSFWMVPVAMIAAAMVFARRDSAHGMVALGLVALMWLAAGADDTSPWSIAVALLMFTAHTSLALRTVAPPGADLGRDVVVRWLLRSAVVAALTAVVFLLAFALRNLHQANAEVILAAALAMLGGLVLLLRFETLDAPGGATRRKSGRGYGDAPALGPSQSRWADDIGSGKI